MTEANEFAKRVAAFIQFNNIDISKVPMDEIVREFFHTQSVIIEDAGIQALGFLSR